LLLQKGADVNSRSLTDGTGGHTALQSACAMSHKDIVQLLLSNGADVNIHGGRRGTASRAAALSSERGGQDIISMLLTHGADIDTDDGPYDTSTLA
jgi:ankyrin repeat protein